MNFEPQKFFIGLIDFFSIFMPGALLTYLVKDWAALIFLGSAGYPLNGPEPIIVFLFASYLLGHAAYLLSSIFDKQIYDRVKKRTEWGQINRLAEGDYLWPRWQRATSKLLFGQDADKAVMQAQRIKARALHHLEAEDAVNAFQWCKARLAKEFPEGLLAVHQFEAASKFFRSLVVVLGALTLFYAYHAEFIEAGLCFFGMPLGLWRYIDQRFKATQQAYWLVISSEATRATTPRQDGLTHAGGIVYRRKNGKTKFMLVTANSARSEWVLPKGHIEPGESPRITAVREVREETAHWARVVGWLDDLPLSRRYGAPMVRWLLLEACEKMPGWLPESRRRGWFSPGSAIRIARYYETKELLKRAAAKLDRVI